MPRKIKPIKPEVLDAVNKGETHSGTLASTMGCQYTNTGRRVGSMPDLEKYDTAYIPMRGRSTYRHLWYTKG